MISSISGINCKNTVPTESITSPANFRGSSVSDLERTPDLDVVEIKKSGKKKSKLGKWMTGIAITLGALSAVGLCAMKRDSKKIAKLCKEKIVLSNLPEHIEFKEAKSIEEGIKYAKEVLGIQKIEGEFSLDAINFVNKGITDVSNAYKGHLYIPNSIVYEADSKNIIASANKTLKSDRFGQLYINQNFFDNEFLNNKLSKIFGFSKNTEKAAEQVKNTSISECKKVAEEATENVKNDMKKYFRIKWDSRFSELFNKFKVSPDNLNIAEKRELYYDYIKTLDKWANYSLYNPTKILESCKASFEREGIAYDYDAISKLPLEVQKEKVMELCKKFNEKTGIFVGISSVNASELSTIFHEMGHLEDFAKNLEKLTQQNSDWSRIKQIWKNKGNIKTELDNVEFVANRWNKISDGKLKELMSMKPDVFKEFYPDLYEHINNEQIKKTAGEVSMYATQGVGEFVAEVHAGLIEGRKFSKEVIDLYKKYEGPIPSVITI